MQKYNVQRYNQSLAIAAGNDTKVGAAVQNINGMIRTISVLAPNLSGANFKLYVLGYNGEALYTSGDLTKAIRTVIPSLAIPVTAHNKALLKVKSLTTTDATGELTIVGDDSVIADGDTVLINGPTDSRTYRFKLTTAAINDIKIIPHVAATAVLTWDNAVNVTDGSVIAVGAVSYTMKAALTDGIIANEVLIGTDGDDSLLNLKKAINGEAGGGTKYGSATVVNPDVSCGAVTAHAVTLTAKVAGAAGNALAKSENDAHLDYDGAGATFTGGIDKGFETLENLKLAIGASGSGDGSDYHAGTTAHADVTAARTNGVLTVTAVEAVESGADVATTEVSGVLSWGAATLVSGGEASERSFDVDLYIERG